MDITRLDIEDPAAVEAWLAVVVAAIAHDVPDLPRPSRQGWIAGLRHPWPGHDDEYWVATEGGQVLGCVQLSLPTLDNLENSDLELVVHPAFRRRGIGRALYAHAVERARFHDRKRVMGLAVETLPGSAYVREGSGPAFAAAMGADRALVEVRRTLEFGAVVSDADLDAQLAEAWTRAADYDLVTWVGPAPDHLVEGMAYLDSRFVLDAPMGDLAIEPEKVDAARVRAGELAADARGRTKYSAGMVHRATGRLVAWTDVSVEKDTPGFGWQGTTIGDPEHRGHRLGTIAKLANLALTREHEPELRKINTWNADSNSFMIAINEAMGFRPVDVWVNYQQEI